MTNPSTAVTRAGSPSPEDAADAIIATAAEFFAVSIEDLCGSRRDRPLTRYRHIAMYLCREFTGLPLARIGEMFGGRSHAAVLHADRAVRVGLAGQHELHGQILELSTIVARSVTRVANPPGGVGGVAPDRGRRKRVTKSVIRRAQLTVAGASHSAQDCRTLLEMLGLLPHQITRPQRAVAATPAQPVSGGAGDVP